MQRSLLGVLVIVGALAACEEAHRNAPPPPPPGPPAPPPPLPAPDAMPLFVEVPAVDTTGLGRTGTGPSNGGPDWGSIGTGRYGTLSHDSGTGQSTGYGHARAA